MTRKRAGFASGDAQRWGDVEEMLRWGDAEEGGSAGLFLVALGFVSCVENRAPSEKKNKEGSEAWGKGEM